MRLYRISSYFSNCNLKDKIIFSLVISLVSQLSTYITISLVSVCIVLCMTCAGYFPLSLRLQTLYTHIVSDIKNVNAKHKNNKVNTVSILAFRNTSI